VREVLRAWISRSDGLDAVVLRRVLREELSRMSMLGVVSAAPETFQDVDEVTEALDSLMGAWAGLGADLDLRPEMDVPALDRDVQFRER
jgi:hypothetical protein